MLKLSTAETIFCVLQNRTAEYVTLLFPMEMKSEITYDEESKKFTEKKNLVPWMIHAADRVFKVKERYIVVEKEILPEMAMYYKIKVDEFYTTEQAPKSNMFVMPEVGTVQ